jgi:hypothetical protein
MRLPFLLLLGLASCSPYSFPREVGAISTGVDQLSNGFNSGFAALAADRAAKTELELTGARAKVAIASTCFASPADAAPSQIPCELYRFGTPAPTLSDIEQLRDRTMAALAVLRGYAHALTAVTNAADRTAYDAAVAQLSGSVGALAKNADAVAPGASTVAPASINLLGWLAGTALDQQRFESLKAGVTAAGTPTANGESPIARVAKTLGAGLVALSEARQQVVVAETQILVGRLDPSLSDGAYRQGLSDAQTAVAVLDGLRQADATAAAKSLVAAHDALLAAVNDPARNYPGLLKAVSDFADRAAALQDALAATTAPAKPPAKKGS